MLDWYIELGLIGVCVGVVLFLLYPGVDEAVLVLQTLMISVGIYIGSRFIRQIPLF